MCGIPEKMTVKMLITQLLEMPMDAQVEFSTFADEEVFYGNEFELVYNENAGITRVAKHASFRIKADMLPF